MRGDFRSKGETVTPDVPQSLPASPDGQPANRLGLARWLVDPGHPLVARVTVNRYRQHYFGVGLVKTSDDFGTQGVAQPSRIARLAGHRVHRRGWDVKAFQKQIVAVRHLSPGLKVDPSGLDATPRTGCWRGPRFRLDAETIRDNAMAVSGLLNPRLGGPSLFPYQPRSSGKSWRSAATSPARPTTSKGDDLYRRGLYTYWKRSSRPLSDGLRRPQPPKPAPSSGPGRTRRCKPWSCSTTRSTSRPPGSWRSGR